MHTPITAYGQLTATAKEFLHRAESNLVLGGWNRGGGEFSSLTGALLATLVGPEDWPAFVEAVITCYAALPPGRHRFFDLEQIDLAYMPLEELRLYAQDGLDVFSGTRDPEAGLEELVAVLRRARAAKSLAQVWGSQ